MQHICLLDIDSLCIINRWSMLLDYWLPYMTALIWLLCFTLSLAYVAWKRNDFFFLNFLSQILPLFEGQFNSVVQNVDIVSSNRFVPLSHLS